MALSYRSASVRSESRADSKVDLASLDHELILFECNRGLRERASNGSVWSWTDSTPPAAVAGLDTSDGLLSPFGRSSVRAVP